VSERAPAGFDLLRFLDELVTHDPHPPGFLGRVCDPRHDSVHMIDGFLESYESVWADRRPGCAVLGLPTSDQEDDKKGGQVQTFERGTLTWNPNDGVVAHLSTDPYGR
jgi:hypothetical protein